MTLTEGKWNNLKFPDILIIFPNYSNLLSWA